MEQKTTLIVRGGGDLASGVIHRLYKCGYQVLVLECAKTKCDTEKVYLLVKQFMMALLM